MTQDSSLLHLSYPPPLTADIALFLDFDGTLVDIAPTPADVMVSDDVHHLLQAAARALSGAVAVISGRPVAVIDSYLHSAVHAVAGIHGAVRRNALGIVGDVSHQDAVRAFLPVLEDFRARHAGVLLEDKGLSIAMHFRTAPLWEKECRKIVADCAAASQGVLVCLDGKMVAELKPAHINKAGALADYMSEPPFSGRRPVFVGDDMTDEDGFIFAARAGGYGVIVGDRMPTAAAWRLRSVADLHHWLKAFCGEAMS